MALTPYPCPKCHKTVLCGVNGSRMRVPCPHCKALLKIGPEGICLAGPIKTAPQGKATERRQTPGSSAPPLPPPETAAVHPLTILVLSATAVACIVAGAIVVGVWTLRGMPGGYPTSRVVPGTTGLGAGRDPLDRRPQGQGQPGTEQLRGRGDKAASPKPTSPFRDEDKPAGAGAADRNAAGQRPSGFAAAVEGVRHSVVTIIAGDEDTPSGQGSGFVVGKRRWIATNHHVVADATRAVAYRKRDDGGVIKVEVAGFIACDPLADLVLLALEKDWPREPLRLATDAARIGEEVFAVGSPKGLTETVTKGIVSSIRSAADIGHEELAPATKIIQTDAFATHGNSGGPLCAASGNVLGINTFVMKDGESNSVEFHFAVSAEELQRLIQSAGTMVRPLSALPRGKARGKKR